MTADDAVMQMNLMNNDFLVFTNLTSGGHFGLIEASEAAAAQAQMAAAS
jgi:hypothetical protein